MSQTDLLLERGARFSGDRVYRYLLWRRWDEKKGSVNFVMLNPSTADEHTNDPTIERCERFVRRWGYGSLVVTNLYALRSTDPRALADHPDPVGPENDDELRMHAGCAHLVVVAWGNHGGERAAEVLRILAEARPGLRPLCLGVNRTGQPVHPLYQPNDAKLIPYHLDIEA